MENNKNFKVTFIDTQNVIVDPKEFKTVVQNLTGKNSSVSWIESNFAESSGNTTSRKELKRKLETTTSKNDVTLDHEVENKSNDVNKQKYMVLGNNEGNVRLDLIVVEKRVTMPLYDCVMLLKPHVKREGVLDLIARVGKHVYARNGVITDIKTFQQVELGYGIKKLDGRYFQGQIMQMTMMATPNINKELHYLNKEDRLLRWVIVKHRDAKYGLHHVNDSRSDPSKFPRSEFGLDFLADEIGKGGVGGFSRSTIYADEDADVDDDDYDEYEVKSEAEKTED
ncbi:hypothetical protein KSS87_003673 [Heliosperma pusillum]|nr:hypothetical protein KSS87_003673 [Heliosperma pusillum]